MFWNKKEEKKVYTRTEKIEIYTQLIKELEDVYLPIRDKCEEVIRSHGLNQYPLSDVLSLVLPNKGSEYEIVIYDVKEDLWDGKKYLKRTDILLDEKFHLDTAQEYFDYLDNEGYIVTYFDNYLYKKMRSLEDPNDEFRKTLSYLRKK